MSKKKNKPSAKRREQQPYGGGKPTQSSSSKPRQQEQRHESRARSSPQSSIDTRYGAHSKPLAPSTRDSYFLFGRNSVEAALANPKRECIRLIGTEKSLADASYGVKREVHDDISQIAATVPAGVPHQGILLEVRPLPGLTVHDLEPKPDQKNIILMLDQVTDPHNVGACMRSAAAFGARAIITQDRNSPDEGGVLARSAAGALEILPWLQVANLAQTLETLRDLGYWHVGLDGNTKQSVRTLELGDNIVIVMGSEGKGLRPLVRKNCDVIAKIPMQGAVESLNVSNAAAIALYELAD